MGVILDAVYSMVAPEENAGIAIIITHAPGAFAVEVPIFWALPYAFFRPLVITVPFTFIYNPFICFSKRALWSD
jgi:hypothetical protein